MLHPTTERRWVSPTIGQGVVATGLIPAGTLTWVHDPLDQRLPEPWARGLSAPYTRLIDRYTWSDGQGVRILTWDDARYMNHACAPNCAGTAFGFEVAVRDIQPGEQLTCDYGTLRLIEREGFMCDCGSPTCRGAITPELGEAIAAELTAKLRAALPLAAAVPQPLAPLLPDGRLREACEALGLPPLSLAVGV